MPGSESLHVATGKVAWTHAQKPEMARLCANAQCALECHRRALDLLLPAHHAVRSKRCMLAIRQQLRLTAAAQGDDEEGGGNDDDNTKQSLLRLLRDEGRPRLVLPSSLPRRSRPSLTPGPSCAAGYTQEDNATSAEDARIHQGVYQCLLRVRATSTGARALFTSAFVHVVAESLHGKHKNDKVGVRCFRNRSRCFVVVAGRTRRQAHNLSSHPIVLHAAGLKQNREIVAKLQLC